MPYDPHSGQYFASDSTRGRTGAQLDAIGAALAQRIGITLGRCNRRLLAIASAQLPDTAPHDSDAPYGGVWADGSEPNPYHPRGSKVFVLGAECGPMLLAIYASCESALDELDERFGHRVDDPGEFESIFGEPLTAESFERALSNGEVRTNSGGTTVSPSHYEWLREYDTLRAALLAMVAAA